MDEDTIVRTQATILPEAALPEVVQEEEVQACCREHGACERAAEIINILRRERLRDNTAFEERRRRWREERRRHQQEARKLRKLLHPANKEQPLELGSSDSESD